jgi:hypothetical protein
MYLKRLDYAVRCAIAVCMVLCCAFTVFSQETGVQEEFNGRGVARITGGDIAGARQAALVDAQKKLLIDAVCAQLPTEALASSFAKLMNQVFTRPDIYLERFKIITENTLPEVYQVTVSGVVQKDMLRHDLESLGLAKPEPDKMPMLLMIAEKNIDQSGEQFWWSFGNEALFSQGMAQQKLARFLSEKGLSIVNPFEAPSKVSLQLMGQSAEPDTGTVCQIASQLGARIIVLGKAVLTRVRGQQGSAPGVQCDVSARAIDAKSRAVVVQASTYALSVQADETAAAQDAAEKACRQLSEQITDRLYQQLRNINEYILKLTFNKPVADVEVRDCVHAFQTVLPGLELIDLSSQDDPAQWTAQVTSPIESTAMLQKMFGTGVAGYVTKITTVHDNVLEIRVAPLKRN